jgi:hypothetical protein
MPVDNSVESLLAPADPRFATPVKPVRQSNGENGETAPADSSSDSDSNAESGKQPNADGDNQPKRPWNGRANYRLVQSWDIGKNRTQDYEVSKQELYLMARKFFEDSRTLKLPTHKSLPTDIHMWKQYRSYTSAKSDALIRIFRCPMKNRAKCPCCIKVIKSAESLELYFLGLHDETSHADDQSAFLKLKQIIAINDGVKYAPQQSATTLRRNMAQCADTSPEKAIDPKLLRSIQHRVKNARQELTLQRLSGHAIDDSYGNLLSFAVDNSWDALIQQHNEADGGFHLDLYAPVVIGHEFDAARDIIHINVSSPWWLLNAWRAINSGWVFQLNADATFNFCRRKVDMIGFGVNSIGGHNHPLCWSLIAAHAEGELTYTQTYNELQSAALLLDDIKPCSMHGCEFCLALNSVLNHPRSEAEITSPTSAFSKGMLPVDSAQCDNILGFGNFTREVFDMDPNMCKCHLLGALISHSAPVSLSTKDPCCRHCGVSLFSRSQLPDP